MFALAAAVVFGLSLILDWANTKVSDAFTPMTLLTLGLLFVALHLAGVGATYNWRTRPRTRSRARR